jgi:hypothetical protein
MFVNEQPPAELTASVGPVAGERWRPVMPTETRQQPSPEEWWVREDTDTTGEVTPWADLLMGPIDAAGSDGDRDAPTPSTDCGSDSGSDGEPYELDIFYAPDESATSDWSEDRGLDNRSTEAWVGQPNEGRHVHAATDELAAGGIDASAAWLRSLSANLSDLPAPEPDDSTVNAGPPAAELVVAVAAVHALPVAGPVTVGAAERKAKTKHNGGCCPLCNEQHDRLSRFWRKFGYGGPPYCLRCAELFRSHQVTCSVKSETCSRDKPCQRCSKVFVHFTKDKQASFAAMDKAQPLSRGRAAYVRPGGDGASACPLCTRTDHGGLGVFWKTFGYAGPPYCTVCSTSFRNHIIRRRGAVRTGCSRESPCSDCDRVLSHFENRDMAFERMGDAAGVATGQVKALHAQEVSALPLVGGTEATPAAPPPAPTHPPPNESQEGHLQEKRVEVQDLNPMTRLIAAEQQQDKKRQRRHERVGAIKSLGAIAVVALGLLILNGGVASLVGGGTSPSPQSAAESEKKGPVPTAAASGLIPLCDVGGGDTGSAVLHPSSSSSSSSSSLSSSMNVGTLSKVSAAEEQPDGGGRFGLCRVRSTQQLKLAIDADSLTCVLFTAPWCSDCDIYASRLLPVPLQTDLFYDNNISFVEVSVNGASTTNQLANMGVLRENDHDYRRSQNMDWGSSHGAAEQAGTEESLLDGGLFPSVCTY